MIFYLVIKKIEFRYFPNNLIRCNPSRTMLFYFCTIMAVKFFTNENDSVLSNYSNNSGSF